MTVIIKSVKDLEGLDFGDSFIIEPDGLPEDPEELLTSDAYKKVLEIETAATEKFATPPEPEKIEGLTVEFTDTHARITSTTDRSITIGGDVRDGVVKLRAGRCSNRKLTGEGFGSIIIDGIEFPVD